MGLIGIDGVCVERLKSQGRPDRCTIVALDDLTPHRLVSRRRGRTGGSWYRGEVLHYPVPIAVAVAPTPTTTAPAELFRMHRGRGFLRQAGRWGLRFVAFLVVGNLVLIVAHVALNLIAPPPSVPAQVTGISKLSMVDERVWRGAAPDVGADAYASLAAAGVTTVVDLRAEDDAALHDSSAVAAGIDVIHLPVRDGQTPSQPQVDAFVDAVRNSRGIVFLHCGAGVGRTGSMAAAYLAASGQASGVTQLARNLAVGPPSLEQIVFAVSASGTVDRPGVAVKVVSRVLDGPRRIWHSLP